MFCSDKFLVSTDNGLPLLLLVSISGENPVNDLSLPILIDESLLFLNLENPTTCKCLPKDFFKFFNDLDFFTFFKDEDDRS